MIIPILANDVDSMARCILNDEILILPTDTVPAMCANAFSIKAIKKIYRFKDRPIDKQIPLFVSSIKALDPFVDQIHPLAHKLMEHFWPGKLTIILKARNLPTTLMNENQGVGFRVCKHQLIESLFEKINCPITGTSANLSGLKPVTNLAQVYQQFKGENVRIFSVDTLSTSSTQPSTIIDFSCENAPVILREGAILKSELLRCMGDSND